MRASERLVLMDAGGTNVRLREVVKSGEVDREVEEVGRLCLVPGEPFSSVERSVLAETGYQGVRVVGYSTGAPGYVFGLDEEMQGGYEVAVSPLTGEAGTAVVRAAFGLLALPAESTKEREHHGIRNARVCCRSEAPP